MRLALRLDRSHLRNWHLQLIGRLAALPDLHVSVVFGEPAGAAHGALKSLFQLEALLHGLSLDGPAGPALPPAFAAWLNDEPADLTLDLGADNASGGARTWRLTYDGVSGEAALLGALLDGATPLVEIVGDGTVIAAGRPGTEYGGVLLASFEDMLARIATLIVAALSGVAPGSVPALPGEASLRRAKPLPNAPALARIAARKLAGNVLRRLYRLCCHAPHWRTGWRKLDGPDLFDLRAHPASGWRDLADDGRRFYADPFPILHEGRVTLFLEEYEHRLGRGVISAVAFGDDGPLGRPEIVLEQPGHLSYPFVFARDDAFWMIPESCSAGTVDLYRATAFPGGWEKHATLVSGITASDATLVEHDGRWWLFATVRDGGGAFSDALHLWSAPDFRGPFTPHPRNPVLIDIASARPAGRFVSRNGALLRPVQDCRDGYGAALGIARITKLDDEGYEQQVETILTAGPLWPGRRLHTLNGAGGFEFIDGSAFARRRFGGMA